MTSNQISLISSWIESDRYYVFRFRMSSSPDETFELRLRVSGVGGVIEEIQCDRGIPLNTDNLLLSFNEAIREFNATI